MRIFTTNSQRIRRNESSSECLSLFIYQQHLHRYVAILCGEMDPPHGTIDTMIGRDAQDRLRQAVTHDERHGKRAITHYKTLEHFPSTSCSLVEFQLETGRTHQIRVPPLPIPTSGDMHLRFMPLILVTLLLETMFMVVQLVEVQAMEMQRSWPKQPGESIPRSHQVPSPP